MPVFHHIRYAWSARFGEPELAAFEEPSAAPDIPSSCPQNKFRLDYIMGNGERATGGLCIVTGRWWHMFQLFSSEDETTLHQNSSSYRC